MAPTRKSRSVNKRYINEVASKKDGDSPNKSGQRKRKLSDMLGPQWSKEELERFYEAYRKYGKDWKKVAAVVRHRTGDMVEALYTMNKAYLSLPEGTASMVGLIAMMTDHYCVLGRSDSEQESNEAIGASLKPQKRGLRKFRHTTSKGLDGHCPDLLQSPPLASSYGCLSSLKRKRSESRPRAVGKRTPRVPVSYSYDKDNAQKYFSSTRPGLKLKVDANDDDVAHEIALALTEASQRGSSPQISQTPNRKTGGATPSPVPSSERMRAESEKTSTKLRGSEMDEGDCELSLGSTEADNGDYARDKCYGMGTEGANRAGLRQKGKRYNKKKSEVEERINNHLDDIKEACSGTEEGQKLGVKGKKETKVTDSKAARSSSKGLKKRSKKVLFGGDEASAFDALKTLADLSLMMPATAVDTESSMQDKDKKIISADKSKLKGIRSGTGVEVTDKSKLGKVFAHNGSAVPEANMGAHQSITGNRNRKPKSSPLKIPKNEAHTDPNLSDPRPIESHKIEITDEVRMPVSKGKRSSYNAAHAKQGKLKSPEQTSSSTDPIMEGSNSVLSTVQVPSASHANLPTKVRSRRKMGVQKPLIHKDSESYGNAINDQPNISIPSFHDTELNFKEKVSNCLSWYQARRWCASEWFYSAIDYPWFSKREFVEYLDHVGLGHVPRLTRVEWGVIRSSLGKPRRFSEQFLKEEREKLNQYRESVRKHYIELRAGTREGLPTDLARPLSVGQRVAALHSRTREIHDGSVLTVDHSRCRIQFDQPELGVEFVMDIDCMPLNPLENLPASFTRHTVASEKFFENLNELKINGQLKEMKMEEYMKISPSENVENTDAASQISSLTYHISSLLSKTQGDSSIPNSQVKYGPGEIANTQQATNPQPSILAQVQAKEADVQALSDLTRALDKKEAVVSELRRMNDEVLENQKDGDISLKVSEPFKKQYAAVLLQLNEINEQVSSALFFLRRRNTYQGNSQVSSLKPLAISSDPGGHLSSSDHSAYHTKESGSHVTEIVESSITKARKMVTAAMQAISSFKTGGNSSEKIEEAIDFVNNRLSVDDFGMPTMISSSHADSGHGTLSSQDQLTASIAKPVATSHASDPKLNNSSDQNEAQIPSELIAHCVATLLMIQKCTERQFPPADIARVLDSAVTSLQPCCSQNFPVYTEIQKCMGIIRNQILALIPT